MSLILKYDLGNPHRLPVGYTPLAYIESSGTLYIDPGSTFSSTSVRSFELIFLDTIGNWVYGTNSSGPKEVLIGVRSYLGGEFDTPNLWKLNELYDVQISTITGAMYMRVNGETVRTSTGLANGFKEWLFADGKADNTINVCRKWRLYNYKIWDNNILVKDFIPAKNSSGVVGLFDCVSQTFFTNSGTGTFIAGPEVVVLPYEYLLVEYLESGDNVNCYINTSFIPDNNTRLVTSIYPTSTRTDAHFWFGSRNGSSSSQAFVFYQSGIATGSLNAAWNTSGNIGLSLSGQKWYDIDFNKNVLKVNGSTAYTFTSGTFAGTYPIFLFAMNTSGSMDGLKGGLKLGITKIYNNGTISRNMIPCYRRSDLKPGMYDTVNNVFYTNAGTGEFILGPVVEESSRQLEYNNAGSNYIGKPINIHHSTSNPSSTLINLGSGNFNTNSWIKLPQLQNLVNGSISFWLKVNTLKNIVIVGNEDELYYLGATRNGTGAWYHHNCGTITTYVDGVIKTTPTADTNWHHIVFTGVNLSTWTTAYLNKYISESSGWNVNGCYYDFRIYDNVLTADEVLKIYKGGV